MIREISIVIWECCLGRIQNYQQRLVRYSILCCLDNITLLGFAIWTAVSIATDDSECKDTAECSRFYKGTFINMVMAFIGFCGQCCCPGPCFIVYYGNKMRQWTD